MENGLPYGNDSGISLFGKIKKFLSEIPPHLWALTFIGAIASILIALYYPVPDYPVPGIFDKITKRTTQETKVENIWSAYTTTPPIGTGKQMYRISGGVQGLPTIEWIMFDPIDPAIGSNQIITVKANDAGPIKAVLVVLHTDNNTDTTYTLTQSAGTSTNGEWKTSFAAKNTYNLSYRATIKVQNQNDLFQMMTVTIR